MNLLGEQVAHRQFGRGTVTHQTETNIEVAFAEGIGTKKFMYPAAFEHYLALENASSQKQMKEELQALCNHAAAEVRHRALEAEKKRALERQEMLAQKRANTKKRAPSAKAATKK